MKLEFKRILSIPKDGACCSLLIFQQKYTIMLDCGINAEFDLSKYREAAAQLKRVELVLISHSSLDYSGAFPFLISQLGMNPKIFYTSQPIMRYSPLNIHQELLTFRIPNYTRKTFNRIYSTFQQMQLVKPHQKKTIDFSHSKGEMIDENSERSYLSLQFTCFLAGGSLGSVYWKISYGLVNIVYLVSFNNYTLNHAKGLDMDNLISQPVNLLLTDGYSRKEVINRAHINREIKHTVMNFYEECKIQDSKPKLFNQDQDQQLLLVCYPSELMVEMLMTLSKIINQFYQGTYVQKIGVIHLSSRFMELVKSQSEYFTPQFKSALEKMGTNFDQSTTLRNRINVCSVHSTQGVLAQPQRNLKVYYIGTGSLRLIQKKQMKEQISSRMRHSLLFTQQEQKLQRSASKISLSKIDSKMDIQIPQKIQQNLSIQQDHEPINQSITDEQFQSNDLEDEEQQKIQKNNFTNRYISMVSGMPRFNLNKRQKSDEMTELGLRHHIPESQRQKVRTIYQLTNDQKPLTFEERMLTKKQSKVEVMNISFQLPKDLVPLRFKQINKSLRNFHKTNFASSVKVLNLMKPKDIIFINLPQRQLFQQYQLQIQTFRVDKKILVLDSNQRKQCCLSYTNQLMLYTMNYLPETQLKKVQKIKGVITKEANNLVQIHLECLEDHEIMSFHLQKFYSLMVKKMRCQFTGKGIGIEIEGIRIHRKGKVIYLEGEYSEQFFKVRKELYNFLGIR